MNTNETYINAVARLLNDCDEAVTMREMCVTFDALDAYLKSLYANNSAVWVDSIVRSAKYELYGDAGI